MPLGTSDSGVEELTGQYRRRWPRQGDDHLSELGSLALVDRRRPPSVDVAELGQRKLAQALVRIPKHGDRPGQPCDHEPDVAVEQLVEIVVTSNDDRPSHIGTPSDPSAGQLSRREGLDAGAPGEDTERSEAGCAKDLEVGCKAEPSLGVIVITALRLADYLDGTAGEVLLELCDGGLVVVVHPGQLV